MTTFLVKSFLPRLKIFQKNPGEKTSGKRKQLSGVLQRAVFMENS
jgi:hypothetical protein